MEPNHVAPDMRSEVTSLLNESVTIASTLHDLVYMRDSSTVMDQVTLIASNRDKCNASMRSAIESIATMSTESLEENDPAKNEAARLEISSLSSTAVSILVNEVASTVVASSMQDKLTINLALKHNETTAKVIVATHHKQLLTTLNKAMEIEAKRDADADKGIENLKSTSWDGSEEKDVRENFLTSRAAVVKGNGLITRLKEHIAELSSGVSELSQPAGDDGIGFGAKSHRLKWARFMLKESKIKLFQALSKGGDVGEAAYESKEQAPPFPIMDQMTNPPKDKRVEICKSWQQWADDPATTKQYCYIIHEFRYMVQAVDPRATHLKPPDQLPSWTEPIMDWNAAGSVDCTFKSDEEVLKKFQLDRMMQWQKLYTQIDQQVNDKMRYWMETVHENICKHQ